MYCQEENYRYHVIITNESHKEITEMYQWSKGIWGTPLSPSWGDATPPQWKFEDYGNSKMFKFKNQEDRNFFLLRWGQ